MEKQNDTISSLCVCGSTKINKTYIDSGSWLGSSSSTMRKYSLDDDRFTTREYSLGFDFYAKGDLLKTKCAECGESDFVAV
jgi:hypothetical protein